MALVAYDCSDSSDIEDEENAVVVTLKNKVENNLEPSIQDKEKSVENDMPLEFGETKNSDQSLFNLLPQPNKNKQVLLEEDDEFLYKKETVQVKAKTKITVPSLSDFKDVEDTIPTTKPKVSTSKKSGLLSILPQPKNGVLISTTAKSFVPHVLTQKPATTVKKKEPIPFAAAKVKPKVSILGTAYLDDSDDDEDIQNDFFSMHKTEDIPTLDTSEDISNKLQSDYVVDNLTSNVKTKADIIQSYFKKDTNTDELQTNSYNMGGTSEQYGNAHSSIAGYESGYNAAESSTANETVLDEEAILKLCGARGKRKREEIQIVDVNQQDVLADARELLLKGLMDDTTKRVSSSKRKGNEPTSQQRRKHQITYLAHQAKANEADLQNQWASNRMSRKQTQSKYGF